MGGRASALCAVVLLVVFNLCVARQLTQDAPIGTGPPLLTPSKSTLPMLLTPSKSTLPMLLTPPIDNIIDNGIKPLNMLPDELKSKLLPDETLKSKLIPIDNGIKPLNMLPDELNMLPDELKSKLLPDETLKSKLPIPIGPIDIPIMLPIGPKPDPTTP